MKTNFKYFPIFIVTILNSVSTHAAVFDWSFVQGGAQRSAAWNDLMSRYVPGRFVVDVSLNGLQQGKRLITIEAVDLNELCLSQQWLNDANIYINPEYYASYFDEVRQCYFIERDKSSQVEFDFSAQKMAFSFPQKGLLKENGEQLEWDYGIPALRANYSVSVSANDVDTTTYGSLGLTGNVGRWVATSSVSASEDDIDVSTVTASRALYDLKADLTVGKTYVGSSLVGGAGLLGVGIVSNSSMRPNELGYTPIFSGVATGNARVTLTQGGRTVYSEMVSPGPFEIANVNLLNSGDVTMTVTGSDGSKTTQLYPLTIVPNMLNPGEVEYGLYSGIRESASDELGGVFIAGNLGYGFDALTLKGSTLMHAKYAAMGVGVITGLGDLGTLGAEGAYSNARYDNDDVRSGGKISVTYAKTFNKSTNLQLIGAQYTSRNYTGFSEFSPWDVEGEVWNNQKTQYELSLSHQLTNSVSTGISGWHRIYWDDTDDATGINARMSAKFDSFSLSFGANYNRAGDNENYSASLSVAVPFSVFDKGYSSYTGITTSDSGAKTYTAGISSTLGERVDYSASVGWSDDSVKTYSLQTGYDGDHAGLKGQLSQTGGRTSGSVSMRGSVIALPTKSDVIFTRNISDTIIVANVADTEGVEFISSPYPSNHKGNAVVAVSAYRENSVTLVGDTLPLEVELLNTNQRVMPTASSVVYMPFDTVTVKRYLFQIKDHQGQFVPAGSWAESTAGVPLGFVIQNGILFVNSVDELDEFQVGSCVISRLNIKETTQLQEVICEE